jgi:hypothetical protein
VDVFQLRDCLIEGGAHLVLAVDAKLIEVAFNLA